LPLASSKSRLLLVKAEVEVIERLQWVTKAGLLTASFQQTIATHDQFIGNQTRDEINGGHSFSLGLL
jgi:hypothetical protein